LKKQKPPMAVFLFPNQIHAQIDRLQVVFDRLCKSGGYFFADFV